MQAAAPHVGVFIVSAELRVLAWSEALERATGLRSEEAIGRYCWDALNAVDDAGEPVCGRTCPFAVAMASGEPVSGVVRLAGSPAARVGLSTYRAQLPQRRLLVHIVERYDADAAATPVVLSPRQSEILHLLADGHSTEQIAEALGISRLTTRNHINAVLRRLDSRSRVEALAKARQSGLVR
jgi:DNA-binding CsgD family transcriptional regulator